MTNLWNSKDDKYLKLNLNTKLMVDIYLVVLLNQLGPKKGWWPQWEWKCEDCEKMWKLWENVSQNDLYVWDSRQKVPSTHNAHSLLYSFESGPHELQGRAFQFFLFSASRHSIGFQGRAFLLFLFSPTSRSVCLPHHCSHHDETFFFFTHCIEEFFLLKWDNWNPQSTHVSKNPHCTGLTGYGVKNLSQKVSQG